MVLCVLPPAPAGQQMITPSVSGEKVHSLVPSICYRSLGDVLPWMVCACVVSTAINVLEGSCTLQGFREPNLMLLPLCLERESLGDRKGGSFHRNHCVIFISHPCTYFTKNLVMIEFPSLLFGSFRKDDHIAPESVCVHGALRVIS